MSFLVSQVNAGFFFAGSELTRGTLLRCWPETLTQAVVGVFEVVGAIWRYNLKVGLWPCQGHVEKSKRLSGFPQEAIGTTGSWIFS